MQTIKPENKVFLWFLFALTSSLVPHPPNCSALLPAAFMMGVCLRPFKAIIYSSLLALSTNLLLGYFYGYPFVGHWICFSLSGLILVTLLGLDRQVGFQRIVQFTLLYWVWTNLDVWLFCNMYDFSGTGLLFCYVAALPFLGFSLLGNFAWLLLQPLTLSFPRRREPMFTVPHY